jgi:hypothetical protein
LLWIVGTVLWIKKSQFWSTLYVKSWSSQELFCGPMPLFLCQSPDHCITSQFYSTAGFELASSVPEAFAAPLCRGARAIKDFFNSRRCRMYIGASSDPCFYTEKSFQTVLQKLQKLDRFKEYKLILCTRNDLAFTVYDVQFGNSLIKKTRPQ